MSDTAVIANATRVIHANWSDERLHLWCEQRPEGDWFGSAPESNAHPHASAPDFIEGEPARITLRVPVHAGIPMPSHDMVNLGGIEIDETPPDGLAEVEIPTIAIKAGEISRVLEALVDRAEREDSDGFHVGPGVRYFVAASRLVEHLIAGHRFVPMAFQDSDGSISGRWQPWLADEMSARRVGKLVRSMPPVARAVPDGHAHDAWSITNEMLTCVTDAHCRRVLGVEEMEDTIESADPGLDHQVAWLTGLLGQIPGIRAATGQRAEIAKTVRKWISELEDRGESSSWRFGLRLSEPLADTLGQDAPDDAKLWSMSFYIQSLDDEEVILRGADIWLINRDRIVYEGLTLEQPQELLMGELGRASRYYKKLEDALDQSEPVEVLLETQEAYRFLREVKPVLEEQGFGVDAPAWWNSPTGRLGTRLRIDSDPLEALEGDLSDPDAAPAQLGLGTLVGYHWEIAIGDTTLTLHEFEVLAQKNQPLVQVNGQWVEIRP